MWTSHVKAFESYRLTYIHTYIIHTDSQRDRQTDRLDRNDISRHFAGGQKPITASTAGIQMCVTRAVFDGGSGGFDPLQDVADPQKVLGRFQDALEPLFLLQI